MTHKNEILKLKLQGKTYNQIAEILNCSKGTISYHCSLHGKEKAKLRKLKYTTTHHPFEIKLQRYQSAFYKSKSNSILLSTIRRRIIRKIYDFFNPSSLRRTGIIMQPTIKLEQIIEKLGNNPRCYLTGEIIDINRPDTYEFDHIIPVSRGGDNSLDNLQICTKKANRAKGNLLPEEFINLCKSVVSNNL